LLSLGRTRKIFAESFYFSADNASASALAALFFLTAMMIIHQT